jgi:hypothetical protein
MMVKGQGGCSRETDRTLTFHIDCYGIAKDDIEQWRCDICKNKKKKTVSYVSGSLLFSNIMLIITAFFLALPMHYMWHRPF